MEFETEWDVEGYRGEGESEEHWGLRRRFIERWKGHYAEERLVCLSRVFANSELLGCRYPAEVARLVAELSREVAAEYREKKKTKLQRTFVSASEAAEDRARGIKRTANEQSGSSNGPGAPKLFVPAQASDKQPFVLPESPLTGQRQECHDYRSQINRTERPSFQNRNLSAHPSFQNNNRSVGPSFQNRADNHRPSFQNRNERLPSQSRGQSARLRNPCMNSEVNDAIIKSKYGSLVLFDRPGSMTGKLYTSCQICKVPILTECERMGEGWSCVILVNGVKAAEAGGSSQKEAKEAASAAAWAALQAVCHTLQVTANHSSSERLSARDVNAAPDKLAHGLDTKVDSAIATRMMKMMGWGGGALGAAGEGINEPITPHLKQIRRAGLGSAGGAGEGGRDMRGALRSTMENFARDGDFSCDLVFASDFSKDERALMHKIALRLGLKSKSYGKDDDRYLVISKPVALAQLVQTLMTSGGSNDKYKLVLPGSCPPPSHQPPHL